MMSYTTKPHFRGYRHFLRCVVPQSAPVCEFFIYLSGFNEDYSRLFRCSQAVAAGGYAGAAVMHPDRKCFSVE